MVTDAQLVQGAVVFSAGIAIIGVLIAGGTLLVFRPRRGTAPAYVRGVPADIPPAVIGVLEHGKTAGETEIAATLLDLAARGLLDSHTVRRHITGVLGGAEITTTEFTVADGAWDRMVDLDRELISMLARTLGGHGSIAIADLKSATRARTRSYRRELGRWQAMVDATAVRDGLLRRSSRTARSMLTIVSVLLVACGAGASMVAGSLLPLLYDAVAAAAVLALSLAISPLTASGARTIADFHAFRRYLTDFGTLDDELPEGITIWSRYLAWAALFGVAGRTLEALRLKVPALADAPDLDPVRAWLAGPADTTR